MARVLLSQGAIRELLVSPTGPVGIDLEKRCLRVEARAKELCPVNTGRLRSSIRHRVVGEVAALVGIIGTDVEYAGFVHDGTRPHVIQPRNASVLAFRVGGQQVFSRIVHHPGTSPHRFLFDALEAGR